MNATASVQNLEEAATLASEYVSSLDNLPSEVQFLLGEIRHKDERATEIQAEIAKESAKYVRHALRAAAASGNTNTNNAGSNTTAAPGSGPGGPGGGSSTAGEATGPSGAAGEVVGEGSKGATPPLGAKDLSLPPKIRASYAALDALGAEKEALAERAVELLVRARARLDVGLGRVLTLQGMGVTNVASVVASVVAAESPVGMYGGVGSGAVVYGGVKEEEPALKKRRLTGGSVVRPSVKMPSPRPTRPSFKMPSPPLGGGYGGSGGGMGPGRTQRLRGTRRSVLEMDDGEGMEEGEQEEEEEEEEGEEDKQIYCFCQKLSYGEMIACDNDECPYQWFHLPCVNLKPPLPENWYCSECIGRGVGVGSIGRKGRKK